MNPISIGSRAAPALYAGIVSICLAGVTTMGAAQKLSVDSQVDRTVDFARLTTYAWLESPALKSDLAPGATDNPGLSQTALEPHIMAAVDRELARRGLKRADSDSPQVSVVYYAALKVGTTASELGSYYQYTTGWALPFAPGSMPSMVDVYEQGSIVVDMVDRVSNKAIWRGSASSRVNHENTEGKRIARINEAIERMFQRFPRERLKGQ